MKCMAVGLPLRPGHSTIQFLHDVRMIIVVPDHTSETLQQEHRITDHLSGGV